MKILIISGSAWIIAQLIKVIIGRIKEKHYDWRYLFGTGGMPSAHSATVCALAMAIGLIEGWDSVSFDISVILAIIVMYDAAGVRRAVSRTAVTLNRISRELREHYPRDYVEREMRELWGHTPFQVFVGAFIGIAVAVIGVYLF